MNKATTWVGTTEVCFHMIMTYKNVEELSKGADICEFSVNYIDFIKL